MCGLLAGLLRAGRPPKRIGVQSVAGFTFSTARSVALSRPTRVAVSRSPWGHCTMMQPPLAAGEMTWLLVRMCPSSSMKLPEPLLRPVSVVTKIVTTEGIVREATPAAVQVPVVVRPGLIAESTTAINVRARAAANGGVRLPRRRDSRSPVLDGTGSSSWASSALIGERSA